MKSRMKLKKLNLSKETLRALSNKDLWEAKGGFIMTETETQNIYCESKVATCTGFC